VLPIQVAALQPDGHGGEALYGRSDQLIAGLERTVDPSGAGNVGQAVRVALVGLAEPLDGFADTPEAQAVAGALRLGVLVVAPAGNDGAAGPWYGSVAGPGGSPAALTVGAVDERPQTAAERLVVRNGLDVIDDGAMPLLDAGTPGSPLELPLRATSVRSRLRGAAVLVSSRVDPAAAIDRALAAGARAVLLAGAAPAAGSLGSLAVPVVAVPQSLARSVRRLLAGGAALAVALGGFRGEPNPGFGRLAPFSSRGLAYDGLVDPELSAPGVGVATADPGRSPPSYATVSGTSAAAAAVAGAAALLIEARPGLAASEVASLLVGSARPGGVPLASGGTGVVDVGASAAGEVAATTTSLGFGVWSGPRWRAARRLTLVDVSTRRLRVRFDPGSPLVRVVPARIVIPPGGWVSVAVVARASARPAAALAAGVLAVVPSGGRALRIPWTISFATPATPLLGTARITPTTFVPSEVRPAQLRLRVGALTAGATRQLEPVGRLELELATAAGAPLGVLATLGDLLPGTYDFALTGRAPDGAVLAPGNYQIVVLAWPTAGGAPTRIAVGFGIQ
jgi:hypothetical protein